MDGKSKEKKLTTAGKITLVEDFIFNDEVQKVLTAINDRFMDFNILEITGMGTQEIKHSNILAWLFGDNEHGLGYRLLNDFLKKIIEKNKEDRKCQETLSSLQKYIYLADHNKDITIYREKDNIDLLIDDKANKVVITIENKVYASESENQLLKYEEKIGEKYDVDVYAEENRYFIFLTKDLDEATNGNKLWLRANHEMVTDVIEKVLVTEKDLSTKSKIILESYVDLLKRRGVVSDEKLKKLCQKIWDNKDYREAFEVIMKYKPNKLSMIQEVLKKSIVKEQSTSGVYNFFLKFNASSPLIYRIIYNTNGRGLGFTIVTEVQNLDLSFNKKFSFSYDNIDSFELGFAAKTEKQYGYYIITNFTDYFLLEDSIDENVIKALLDTCREYDNQINSIIE